MDTPNLPERPVNPGQPSSTPVPWWEDRTKLILTAALSLLAVVVLTLMFMVFYVRGDESAVASATPSPTASTVSVAPTASPPAPDPTLQPSASADPTPGASASASAEPSGPPQAKLSQGWAKLTTGLNLRDGPGTNYVIVAKLLPGEVVWINSTQGYSDENADDEFDWYSIQTLTDRYGWIASGEPDDPHATNLSDTLRFRTCGPAQRVGNSAAVNGLRTGRLPDVDLATFELAQARGTNACLVFANEEGEPRMRTELDVHACGAPTWDGSVARLQPTTNGSVDPAWRVSTTIVVPKALLIDRQRQDEDHLTNQQKFFMLGSRLTSPFLCARAELVRAKSRTQTFTTEIAGCLTITAKSDDFVTFAASSGEPVTLRRVFRDGLNAVQIGDARRLHLIGVRGTLKAENLGDC